MLIVKMMMSGDDDNIPPSQGKVLYVTKNVKWDDVELGGTS